ncbi:MAG: DUF4230 domain-containing protein [Actinomycetota bacterium]|jgi:hypothetical protein|nr:DUF4230 domain-containing protein [Actinomycetota bacterium]
MIGKKVGGIGTTFVLALVIVVLSVALGVGIGSFDFMERMPVIGPLLEDRPPRTTTGPVVVEGIQELDQLATVRWTESVLVTRESGGTDLERTLTGERVLLVATGDVEAGVSLAELGEDDVRVDGEAVTIRLPKPEILFVSLDEEETRVYDRDFGPLNFRPDDGLVEEARDAALDKIEKAARDEDILDQAEQNTENSIRAFVTSLGFKEVRFE